MFKNKRHCYARIFFLRYMVLSQARLLLHNSKVKVVPYTFVRKGVHIRGGTYPEPSACEVGWPVPFLAAFVSPVLPPGTIRC